MTDYRRLRLHNLGSPEYRHVLLLLYWIPYFVYFMSLERLIPQPVWHTVWCPLDDRIPFLEGFVIPYLLWYVYLVGMHIYLLLYDVEGFKKMSWFFMISFTATMAIYTVYPTCQNLRPEIMPRDNWMARLMQSLYVIDTSTNVCPSLHVIGSMAVVFAAWNTTGPRFPLWRTSFLAAGLLISFSTLFVKQHSVLDVFYGFLLSGIVYLVVYRLIPGLGKRREKHGVHR